MDPNNDFVVCTDACNDGLGGVLTQEGYVIAYKSKKLKIHEKNLRYLISRIGCCDTCFKDVAPSLDWEKIYFNDR